MELSESNGIPLYVQVRDSMLDRIKRGHWKEHDRIPTEHELESEYGVGRSTIRRALAELEQRGIIYRKAGRGTFVRARVVPLVLRRSVSFTADMLAKGMEPGATLISAEVVPAQSDTAEAVGVPVGTPVVRIVRLRLADGRPVLINDICLLSADCPGLESRPELRAPQSSVYQIITRHYGIEIANVTGHIRPVLADDEVARYLDVEAGAPIFRTEVVGKDGEGRAVIYATDLVRGDWAFDIGS